MGPEADVYAFAILAWIVVCGEQPYAKMLAAATSLPQAVAQGVRPTLADAAAALGYVGKAVQCPVSYTHLTLPTTPYV